MQFIKRKLSNGGIVSNAIQTTPQSDNSALSFLNHLTKHDAECFIDDLTRSLFKQLNIDEGFFSDSVEDLDILYQYPNVNINHVLLLPMQDMKEILEEWLAFTS